MNKSWILKETGDGMNALSELANTCYDKGCRDTLIGVAVGAGLVVAGYIGTAFYQIYKNRKSTKELRNHLNDFGNEEKES